MQSTPKIMVLQLKEVIYTVIFVILGILLVLLLIFMFLPDKIGRAIRKKIKMKKAEVIMPEPTVHP